MNTSFNKYALIISGPTATGKSDFVLQLGEQLNNRIEIINADIGSFYKNMSIGVAKPDWQVSSIPHHFFDIFDQPENWTAPQFRAALQKLIHEIWDRENIPVIVGGSVFYIQSFFYKNHDLPIPSNSVLQALELYTTDDLYQKLSLIDPMRSEEIDRHDRYRLIRALAIWESQGIKPSACKQIFSPLANFHCIFLTRDRDQLYSIIDQRVENMMAMGWVKEVEGFMHDPSWMQFLYQKKMIGYNELLAYLQGHSYDQSFEEIVDIIKQRTRNYAKRQITFLKKLAQNIRLESVHTYQNSSMQEFNLTYTNNNVIVENIRLLLEDALYNP